MHEIIVDNPLVPLQLEPVPIARELGERSRRDFLSGRRGIKRQPAKCREENFYPAMRIAGAHDKISAYIVIFSREESVDDSRGDALRPQHHGHGGSEVFAVSRALVE